MQTTADRSRPAPRPRPEDGEDTDRDLAEAPTVGIDVDADSDAATGPALTSATGGSAATQAIDADPRRWRARPRLALLLRVLAVAGPAACSTLAVHLAARTTAAWHGLLPGAARLALLLAAAVATLVAVDRAARRLLPLAALCRLALAFPDRAPSRFKLALRTGTANQLARQLGEGMRPRTDVAGAAEQVLVLAAALGHHDRLTRGHSERVRAYADLVAEELDLPAGDRERLHWAALVHDIGKIAVRPAVLNKAGRPSDAEWQELRRHPEAAAELIEPLRPWLGEWADAATQHHERPDGTGYPLGLRGAEISLAGRIVAVADAYDCMTSARSYKRPLPAEQARFELARNAGTQFDEDVVRAFLAISIARLRLVAGPLAWLSQLSFPGSALSAAPPALVGGIASVVTLALGTMTLAPVETAATYDPYDLPAVVAVDPTAGDAADGYQPPDARDGAAGGTTDPATGLPAAIPGADLLGGAGVDPSAPLSGPGGGAGPSGSGPSGTGSVSPAPGPAAPVGSGTTTTTTVPPGSTTTTTTASNGPPHAVADGSTVILSNSVTIDVLANDTDPDGALAPATLSIVSPPGIGSAVVTAGKVRYTAPLFSLLGSTSLTYRICDTKGACATAVVTVTIVL
ncbi:MAG: HD domain-containing phosphohydrolase [Acidimicrobiia bacterium]